MKNFKLFFALLLTTVLSIGQMWAAETCTLTSAQIKAGSGSTSYGSCSATDGCSKTWNAYAIKNQHSKATADYHFWQIKKYASSTAYYVQVPEMAGNITQLKITVSNTSKARDGGGNTATLFFSSSNSTSSAGTGVASGTGDSEVTIDCSSLDLATGYITASAAVRIWDVEVTYATGGGDACATPTFSPVAGAVLSGTTVALATKTTDADIYYTMGASPADPTSSSTKYTTPISITEATTIKAIAIKSGLDNSAVASASYTVATPLTTMQAIFDAATSTATPQFITFSDSWVVTGVSTNGKNVYITDGTKGMILYNGSGNIGLAVGNTLSGTVQHSLKLFNGAAELDGFTIDGLTKGTASVPAVRELDAEGIEALSGVNTGSLIKISGACSEENSKLYVAGVQLYNTLFAYTAPTAGNTYNVTGVYVQYNTTKESIKEILPRSAADIEEVTASGAPEAPTFSVPAGEYTAVQTVELSCATDGATIYYTTDGTTPDNTKTKYTAAITVDASMTIKAIAIKDDLSSAIVSAAYTIDIPLPSHDFQVTHYFSTGEGFEFPEGWSTTYEEHEISFTDDKVVFESANKPASTASIKDRPVSKDKAISLILTNSSKSISAVRFDYAQWGTKAQTLTMKYSTDGGETYNDFKPVASSAKFVLQVLTMPEGVNAIQVTGSNSDNQVGLTSIAFDLVDKAVETKTVTVTTPENGTLVVKNAGTAISSGDAIAVGTTLTIEATPATGYLLSAVSVVDEDENPVSVSEGAFVVPNKNVTISAVFSKAYSITIDEGIVNGKVESDKTSACKDETVTLTITPAENYKLESLNVSSDAGAVEVTDNKFTMPDADVTITATFIRDKYTITIDPTIKNGTVEANKSAASAGETVEITAHPNAHYTFGAWDVFWTEDEDKQVDVASSSSATTTFTMPEKDVTVWARFNAIKSAVTIANPDGGTISVKDGETAISSGSSVAGGKELTVAVAPNSEAYKVSNLRAYKTGDPTAVIPIEEGKLTMPDYAITITADATALFEVSVAVNNTAYGSATINAGAGPVYVANEEMVNLVATPAGPQYEFVNWTASNDDILIDNAAAASTTAMIGAAGTITANFKTSTTPSITVTPTELDFGKVALNSEPVAQKFKVVGVNLTGDQVTLSLDAGMDDAFVLSASKLDIKDGAVDAEITVTPKTDAAGDALVNIITVSATGVVKTVDLYLVVQKLYTAKWYLNGEELTESTQTDVEGTALIIPSNPAKLADDCEEFVFRGWASAAIDGKLDDAPDFANLEGLKMAEHDTAFYAVFAKEEVDKTAIQYSHSIVTDDFTSNGGYAANNNEKTRTAKEVADPTKELEVKWTSYQVMYNNNKGTIRIQGKGGEGQIYNEASWGKIKSITFNDNDGGSEFSYVIGSSSKPTESAEGGYFLISAGSSTSKASSIDIVFEVEKNTMVYKEYRTTCPVCTKVTLKKAATENGSFILTQNGVEVTAPVKTCDPAEIKVEATPNPGYYAGNPAITELEGAAISGTTLSLAAGATGETTVSVEFLPNEYKVTMAKSGCDDATISGDQEGKHVGDVINISANEKEGYIFLGWTANQEVTFAKASDLATTFTMPASDVTITANYTKILTVAEALALENGTENVYVQGIVSNIKSLEPATYVRAQYYISDNGLRENELYIYNGRNVGNTDFTAKDQLIVGDKLMITGKFVIYNKTKELDQDNYIVTRTAAEVTSVVIEGDATYTKYENGDDFKFDGLTAKAVYNTGYEVAIAQPEWSADPAKVTTNGNITVTATYQGKSGQKIVAVEVLTHEVTFAAPQNGTLVVKADDNPITTGDHLLKGDILTFVATPAEGYRLASLKANDVEISASEPYVVGTEDIEIVVTFEEKAEAPISWSAAAATAYTKGKPYSLPTLSNEKGLTVVYESLNTAVAEIAANGDVTIKGAGSATIKASFEGNADYKAAVKSYELTVKAPASVAISGSAAKTSYTENENFDFAGLKLIVKYDENDTWEATASEVEWAADPAKMALTTTKVNVTAKWNEMNAPEFEVTVTVSDKPAADISWPASSAIAYTVGKEYDPLPTLKNEGQLIVTYESSDEAVATIDQAGNVTIKAAGSTSIKAVYAGDETHRKTEVAYTLTVYAPQTIAISGNCTKTEYDKNAEFSYEGLIATVTYGDDSELDVTAQAIWSNDLIDNKVAEAGNVTVKATWNGIESDPVIVAVTVKEDPALGIDQMTNDQLPITNKVMINGIIYIQRGDKLFNAQGQVVR